MGVICHSETCLLLLKTVKDLLTIIMGSRERLVKPAYCVK